MNNGTSCLQHSITNDHVSLVTGPRLPVYLCAGNTALHLAAQMNWLQGVKLLVLYGSTPRARNAAGATPLHLVAESGKRKVASYLLELKEEWEVAAAQNGGEADVEGKVVGKPKGKPWRSADPNIKGECVHVTHAVA